jgi:hypothetical protein
MNPGVAAPRAGTRHLKEKEHGGFLSGNPRIFLREEISQC